MDTRWLAGFFDGEGCCGLYANKHHPQVMLTVVVVQKDRTVLDEISVAYPEGKVVLGPMTGGLGKPCKTYRFRLYGQNARRFLEDIQPHVKVKRVQVDIALKFINMLAPKKAYGRGYEKMSPKVVASRELLMAQMKEANQHNKNLVN